MPVDLDDDGKLRYIALTDCNDNLLRQAKFWNIDARCPANNAIGAVHAQMEHYLHYIFTRITAVHIVYLQRVKVSQ